MNQNENNPIEQIMSEAMLKVKSIIDVDTIIGTPIITQSGITVVPISKVSVGFVAGGGEYSETALKKSEHNFPFAGGSGVGFTVTPMGFLNLDGNSVELISAKCPESPYAGLTDVIAKLLDAIAEAAKKKK